jgi:pyruvate/2-oxoglutarate dehydrogenase complex dihydrolipoamide acyltransferase (E2) component
MITSLPRPVLIAIVGVVAVAALLMISRRGNEQSGTTAPAPAPSAQTKPPASTSAGKPAAPSAERAPAEPVAGSPVAHNARRRTLPPRVKHALDAHKVVVILFWSPRGTDDRSVKRAVDSLSRRGGDVAVFSDRPRNLARYTKITSAADVTQTPTLVVVDRHGKAREATGYLDSATIEQYVVDALHGAR